VQANYFKRQTCRLCQRTALAPVLSLVPTPLANEFLAQSELSQPQDEFPLDLHLCSACGHLQLVDVVDPARLFERYVYVSGTSPVFVQHFNDYAETVVARYDLSPGDLAVDIGSNDGVLLRALREHGLQILGVDPARDIAQRACEAGIPTRAEFFTRETSEQIRKEYGKARLVTANNMFAHSDTLDDIARSIANLLTDDGIFVFEVSYLVDVYEQNLFDTIYHEHLAYHAIRPLEMFFADRGLALFDVERISTHGGSVRVFVQLAHGPRARQASVDTAIAYEESLGLFDAGTYAGWLQRIEAQGLALREMLSGLLDQGLSVAGFGAPAKATTLLHQFKIDHDVLQYIIDDSPWKQGLYTPGQHIPVVGADVMTTRRPDCLLILAWNFADPIIARYQSYLDAGGRFIVPLPELRMVTAH
jgi:SAM-dependent methyltransferase